MPYYAEELKAKIGVKEDDKNIPKVIGKIEDKTELMEKLTYELGEMLRPVRVETPRPRIERDEIVGVSPIAEHLINHLNKLDELYEYIMELKEELDI